MVNEIYMLTQSKMSNEVQIYNLTTYSKEGVIKTSENLSDLISARDSDMFYTNTIEKKIQLWTIEEQKCLKTYFF